MTAAFCAEKALRGLFALVISAAVPSKKGRPQSGRPSQKLYTILINPLYIVDIKFVVGIAAEVVAVLARGE